MASLGDLVLNLKLGNQTFARNMRDSGRMAQQLALDTEKLTRSTLSQQDAANRLSQFLTSQTVQFKQQAAAAAASNLATVQARSANQLLAVELGNATVQANRLTQAELALDRELMQSQQQLRDNVARLSSATMQSKQLALSQQQLRNSIVQLRQENQQAALVLNSQTTAALNLKMAEQQLLQRSLQHTAAKKQETAALQQFNVVVGLSAATQQRYAASLASANMATAGVRGGSAKAQMAIQQLVFAVDDAASSFGTGGWSGAIRGSANNLSMLAGILGGPYGLAAGVAITATTQLYLAMNKTSEEAETLTARMDKFRTKLEGQMEGIKQWQELQRDVSRMQNADDVTALRGLGESKENDLADLAAQRKELVRQQELAANVTNNTRDRTWGQMGRDIFSLDSLDGVTAAYSSMQQHRDALEQLKEIGERITANDQARVKLQSELNFVQQESSKLAKSHAATYAETHAAEAKRAKELVQLDRQRMLMALERHRLESGAGLRKQLAAEIDPRAGRMREIADEARERMKQARLNPETFTSTRSMILQAALAKMSAEEKGGKEAPRGPEGLQRGSRELLERMRQREMERNAPQKEELGELKKLAALMKQGVDAENAQQKALEQFKNNYVVVGAFD